MPSAAPSAAPSAVPAPGPTALPPRVWVVGPTGSGKSTLADRLASILGVEATHLDDLHWAPGWVERPREDLARRLAPVVEGAAWVVDGNYGEVQRRFVHHADLIVWLDVPLATTFRRLLARSVARARRGTPCCNGNRETLARTFLSRDSILLWALTSHRRVRRRYARTLAGRAHVRFTDPRRLERWVAALERAAVVSDRDRGTACRR